MTPYRTGDVRVATCSVAMLYGCGLLVKFVSNLYNILEKKKLFARVKTDKKPSPRLWSVQCTSLPSCETGFVVAK